MLLIVGCGEEMPVTFQKELVTDTWFVPPSLRRLRQIIISGTGAEEAWRILTNPKNNSDLNNLVRDGGTRNALQRVLAVALEDWNRADNEIDEGLVDLQAEHDPDSAIPSTDDDDDDDLRDALSGLYVARRFQNRFIYELPSPMGNSQASTEATSGQEEEEEEEEEIPNSRKRNRAPPRPIYVPDNWNKSKRRRQK